MCQLTTLLLDALARIEELERHASLNPADGGTALTRSSATQRAQVPMGGPQCPSSPRSNSAVADAHVAIHSFGK